MPDRKPATTDTIDPLNEQMLLRFDLARRWKCSEKSVERAEPRLGLEPLRFLRGIRYRLSDVLRIEQEGAARLPKKWTGLRPDQKDALRRREQEELSQQPSLPPVTRRAQAAVKQEARP